MAFPPKLSPPVELSIRVMELSEGSRSPGVETGGMNITQAMVVDVSFGDAHKENLD